MPFLFILIFNFCFLVKPINLHTGNHVLSAVEGIFPEFHKKHQKLSMQVPPLL